MSWLKLRWNFSSYREWLLWNCGMSWVKTEKMAGVVLYWLMFTSRAFVWAKKYKNICCNLVSATKILWRRRRTWRREFHNSIKKKRKPVCLARRFIEKCAHLVFVYHFLLLKGYLWLKMYHKVYWSEHLGASCGSLGFAAHWTPATQVDHLHCHKLS